MMSISRVGLFLILVSIFFSLELVAQSSSSSPYSIYGLGDVETSALSRNSGMARARLALADPVGINIANPATYSHIRLVTFDVGLRLSSLRLTSTAGGTQNNFDGYLKNIVFAFPLNAKKKRKWGISFGILPFSRIGYSISDTDTSALGDVEFQYEGEGGINRAYFGSAYDLINDTNFVLSFGANLNYLFGPVTRTKRTIFSTSANAFNTRISNTILLNDFNADFGLYSRWRLVYDKEDPGKLVELSFGATYTPSFKLKATNNTFAASYTGTPSFERIRDTITNTDEKGLVAMPSNVGLGVAFDIHRQWTFAFDASRQDWSEYSFFGANEGLKPRDELAFGFQYVHDYDEPGVLQKKGFKKLPEIIRFRAGVRYANTRLDLEGDQLSEYGINFGVLIPLVFNRGVPLKYMKLGQFSSLNIGVEYGERGNTNNGLIKEQFTNINIGFTFVPYSPDKYDKWFNKVKIK